MAVTFRDGVIVAAVVLGLILVVTLIAVFIDKHNDSDTDSASSSSTSLAVRQTSKRPPTSIGSLGAFGFSAGTRQSSTTVTSKDKKPPPPPSTGGCPVGKLAKQNASACKASNRAALNMNKTDCPSSLPNPSFTCVRDPDQWTLSSTYTGQASYILAGANDCVQPKGDISMTNLVTRIDGANVTLSGGHAVLRLTNNGQCDARLVNVIAQLIQVPSCVNCSDSCDDSNDDDDHDSDGCDISRNGQVVAATAEESTAVRNCPSGGNSPATVCNTHGGKNKDCLVDIPFNEGIDLIDSSTGLPLNLNSYVVPKQTQCNQATVINIDYAFQLTIAQWNILASSGQYIIKFLVTYDTCCAKGHTCGIDYDCDGIVESIRTISLESRCFSFTSNPCPEKCSHADFTSKVRWHFSQPPSSSLHQIQGNVPVVSGTVVVINVTDSSPPSASAVIPELCCNQMRSDVGAPLSSTTSIGITLTALLAPFGPCPPQVSTANLEVVCSPISPVDCQVSEWSSFTPCALNCTQQQVADCVASLTTQKRQGLDEFNCLINCGCGIGAQNRTRTITVPPSNGGAACPALIDSEQCFNTPSFTPCTCPGPTQNATFADLPGAQVNVTCVVTPPTPVGCNTVTCGTDCVVSEWSSWSPCFQTGAQQLDCTQISHSCAISCYQGLQSRTRSIVQQPTGNGLACPVLSDFTFCLGPTQTESPCTEVQGNCPSNCNVTAPFDPNTCAFPLVTCV